MQTEQDNRSNTEHDPFSLYKKLFSPKDIVELGNKNLHF
jgi:hypothetical protein